MTLRILHVVRSIHPEAGTVGVCLRGLFSALETRGIESEALSAGGSEAARKDVGNDAAQESNGLLATVSRVDIVHLHGCDHGLTSSVARAARRNGKPYVVSPHGSLTPGRYNRRTWKEKVQAVLGKRRWIRRASAIIALNEREAADLRKRRVHSKVVTLPYGLSFDDYNPVEGVDPTAPTVPNGRCLLMLAPIEPIEGCVVLLKAFAELGRDAEGWSIILAGSNPGPWRNMLEAAVRRKGGDGRVLFVSAPDVATQRALLTRASVVAAPSLHIRPPVSIMQALASRTPVVATNLVAPDGLDGSVRVCDPTRSELREALRSVVRLDDAARVSIGEQARSTAATLFDWSVLADRYVQLYQNL